MIDFLVSQEKALSLIGKKVMLFEHPEFTGVCTAISNGSVYLDGIDTCIDMNNFVLATVLQEGEVVSAGNYGMVWPAD